MSAGKNVPPALHTELSEYASLLRAIRANSTLDLVPQLTSEVTWTDSLYYDESESESDVEDQLLDKSAAEEETQPGPSVKGKEKEVEAPRHRKKQKKNNDDLWTRWPLLPEHCPEPEWTLDEEVAAIAERCIHVQNVSSTPPQSSNDEAGPSRASNNLNSDSVEEEDIEEFDLSPAFLSGLSLNTVSKLTSLLSLLAAHRLDATWSKHNRVAPMNWRDILEIAGMSRLFDLSIVADVQKRLEATFGTSDTQVVHRMRILDDSDRKLAAAISGDDLFDVKPPKSYYAKRSKRKRMHDDEGDEKIDNDDGEQDDDYSDPESHPDYEDDGNESTSQLDDDLDEDVSRQLNESPDVGAVE